MPVSQTDIERLTQRTEESGAIITFEPGLTVSLNLPGSWSLAVRNAGSDAGLANLWGTVENILPKTLALLERKIQGIGLLETDVAVPSLVYFFKRNDRAYAFRGFAPAEPIGVYASKLPESFLQFYR